MMLDYCFCVTGCLCYSSDDRERTDNVRVARGDYLSDMCGQRLDIPGKIDAMMMGVRGVYFHSDVGERERDS